VCEKTGKNGKALPNTGGHGCEILDIVITNYEHIVKDNMLFSTISAVLFRARLNNVIKSEGDEH
jgi:hypothetical protein